MCRVMSSVFSLLITVGITFILPKLDLKNSIEKNVFSLLITVGITFILPKLDLKNSIEKQLNFSNSIICSVWKTEQLFIIFFSFIIPKSTLQKRSIIYYYLSSLIIDLS